MAPNLGFWNHGRREHLETLRREEDEQSGRIMRDIAAATDPEVRKGLQEQLEAVKEEFRRKRKAAGRSLFMKA